MTIPGHENEFESGEVGDSKGKYEIKMDGKGQWGAWKGDEWGEGIGRRRTVGIELEEIPLCAVCSVETAGESQVVVLEKGIETVTKFDGGLSRDRLSMMSEGSDEFKIVKRHKLGRERVNTMEDKVRDEGNADDRVPLLEDAAEMPSQGSGTTTSVHSQGESECNPRPEAKEIDDMQPAPHQALLNRPDAYVSLFDPINEPAFKPSKTKPLPKWMNLLPSNVYRERELRANLRQSLDGTDGSQSPYTLELKTLPSAPVTSPHAVTVTTPSLHNRIARSSRPRSGTMPVQSTAASSSSEPSFLIEPQFKSGRKRNTISFDNKVKKHEIVGDLGDHAHTKSQTIDSTYGTPPEYPSTAPPPRERTPFPRMARPNTVQEKASSYFNQSISHVECRSPPTKEWYTAIATYQDLPVVAAQVSPLKLDSPPKPTQDRICSYFSPPFSPPEVDTEAKKSTVAVVSSLKPEALRPQPRRGLSPVQQTSLERLEMYNPGRMVPRAGKPEPIFEKIRRQKKRRNMEIAAERKIDISTITKLGSDQVVMSPWGEDLQRELKNLFRDD
ncbi:hypothetical protein BGZ60DRAFT_566972 [Tricladium varicosporioides]|nr:hypothetical protein BGZ60DRAFT_566972 [Hymenoscyphus varicosporioides]